MLKQINKSIKFLKKSSIFLKILIILAVIYVINIVFNKTTVKEGYSNLEHFNQETPYINKKNDETTCQCQFMFLKTPPSELPLTCKFDFRGYFSFFS